MLPPFVQQVLGVLVRMAVVFLSGWVAAHGGSALSDDQIGKVVSAAVPVLAVLAWSVWQKYQSRRKLLTALASNGTLSENHVELMVGSGQAPSVLTPKHEAPVLQKSV